LSLRWDYDEPEPISYAISSICPVSPDGKHLQRLVPRSAIRDRTAPEPGGEIPGDHEGVSAKSVPRLLQSHEDRRAIKGVNGRNVAFFRRSRRAAAACDDLRPVPMFLVEKIAFSLRSWPFFELIG
jgi:hypothetical protein